MIIPTLVLFVIFAIIFICGFSRLQKTDYKLAVNDGGVKFVVFILLIKHLLDVFVPNRCVYL